MTKKIKQLMEAGAWLLGAVLLRRLFIPFGIELCDTGFFLTNQRGIHVYGELCPSGFMTFFSDVVGGLWLGLLGSPSWAWARLGGAVVGGVTVAITYWTFKDKYRSKSLRAVLLLPTLLVGGGIIDYYTFPSVLLSLIFCILYRVCWQEVSRLSAIGALLIGSLLWLGVLSRFPLILLPFGCLLVLLLGIVTDRIPLSSRKHLFLGAFGFFAAMIATFLVLKWSGMYAPVIQDVQDFLGSRNSVGQDDSHNLSLLFSLYINRTMKATIGAAIWLGVVYLVGSKKLARLRFASWVLLLGLGWLMMFFKVRDHYAGIPRFREILVFSLAFICLHSFWVQRKINPRESFLSFISVVLMMALPVGSNAGFALALVGSSACICNLFLGMQAVGNACQSAFLQNIARVRLEFAASIVITLLSFTNGSGMLYGVAAHLVGGGPVNMTRWYTSQTLVGMRGEPEYGGEIDTVIEAVRRSVKKDETVFALNYIGGFNYLTETRPFLKTTLIGAANTNVVLSSYNSARETRGDIKALVWARFLENDAVLVMLKEKAISDYNLTRIHRGKFFDVYSADQGVVRDVGSGS